MANVTREQMEAFWADYRAVCERHGLVMGFDDGYVSSEIRVMPDDMDWDFFHGSAANG